MKKSTKNKNDYNRQYMEKLRRSKNIQSREDVQQHYYNQFLVKSNKIHNNRYEYNNVHYINGQTKVIIGCAVHGSFYQTPEAHMRGQGCPQCSHIDRLASRKRKTQEQFVSEANQQHQNKYTYLSPYVNLITKISISCPDHGIFTQTPKAHLRGQGCPMCANERRLLFFQSKGELKIEEYLISHNIKFEKQKMFDGCIKTGKLRFDFYLPAYNTLIEFDGEQHYKFIKKFHRTTKDFIVFQERDNIKDQFAVDQGIALLRIRFDQQQNITTILSQSLN